MIALKKIRELNDPLIAAASGLVELSGKFFIVSDDENFLGIYEKEKLIGTSSNIFKDILPEDKAQRKKLKHDIEGLAFLPQSEQFLLIPSGSTPMRQIGALLATTGEFIREIAFEALYLEITKTFSELNIEGAVAIDKELYLFQRGNGSKKQNGIISFNLEAFLTGKTINLNMISLELGFLNGVNLSFTDATSFKNHFLFLAVAEDSDSTYLDGSVVGSVIGVLSKEGRILCVEQLDTTSKPEGLSYSSSENCFYLVTDDDDRNLPSSLYSGVLPVTWTSLN